MNPTLIRAASALAAAVALGVLVQIYLIAAYAFGADALDAHKHLGNAILPVAILAGILGAVGWKADRRAMGVSIALVVVAVVQVGLAQADTWAGGFHGLLAVAVLALAAYVHVLGLRAWRGA